MFEARGRNTPGSVGTRAGKLPPSRSVWKFWASSRGNPFEKRPALGKRNQKASLKRSTIRVLIAVTFLLTALLWTLVTFSLPSSPVIETEKNRRASFQRNYTATGHHHRPSRFAAVSAVDLLQKNDPCGDNNVEDLDACLLRTRFLVHDRIYEERFKEDDLPCYHPTDQLDDGSTFSYHALQPAVEGLFFLRLATEHTSTSTGVHLRLARNRARRQNDDKTVAWPLCKTRHDVGFAGPETFHYGNRHKTQSLLWTMLEDPTQRTLGDLVRQVQVEGMMDDDRHALDFLQTRTHSLPHYYARLSTTSFHKGDTNLVNVANQILQDDYDFVGVEERLDESLVCLMMLWNVPLADMLYVSGGDYTVGKTRNTCSFHHKPAVSVAVQEFLQSSQWKRYINLELALHQAANRSLDRTIDSLGREDFQIALDALLQAQKRVQEVCGDRVRFPCTKDGVRRRKEDSDCLTEDAGCGFECLDKVATELDLW